MGSIQKAYQSGYRMGKYIKDRDGLDKAVERGSLAEVRYSPRMR